MLPEARTGAFALGTIRRDAVAESLPRGVRGHLVRGAVLPAAAVCLPRGDERAGRAGALRGDGAAAVFHHDPGRAARGAVRRRHARRRARVPGPGLDACEAAAGRGAGRLPRLVLPTDAGAARGREPPLAALVSPVQRVTGAAAGRDRGTRGRQALKLPDPDALLGLDIEPVARLYVERRVPRVDVRQRSVDAEVVGAVHVGHHLLAQRALAVLAAPHLRVGEEEALIAREPIDHGCRLALE